MVRRRILASVVAIMATTTTLVGVSASSAQAAWRGADFYTTGYAKHASRLVARTEAESKARHAADVVCNNDGWGLHNGGFVETGRSSTTRDGYVGDPYEVDAVVTGYCWAP